MVRPVVRVSNHSTEMEIKTLKLSYDNQTNVRAPMVWEKPTAGLYDYHYEIDGLYYQPMISYCMGRSAGARRKVVDIPDRIMSNYDKRSYKLKNDEVDYEGFLTQSYQRRMKDINSKKIHCANESIQRSKKTTDLGMARGSAMIRDKYLNQVQMMYTEKLARSGKMKGLVVENFGSDGDRMTRAQSVECEVRGENKLLSKRRNDARYGPAYERITVLDSEQYNRGEIDSFLPEVTRRAVSEERAVVEDAFASKTEETSSKTVHIVNTSGDVSEEYSHTEGGSNRKALMNRDYLTADNMNEFLKVRDAEQVKKEAVAAGPEASLYLDATYSKAIKDVRNRVKRQGNTCLNPKPQIDDLKLNYRGKTMDQVGNVEKAFIRSTMYNKPSIPDIDVGYDVIG